MSGLTIFDVTYTVPCRACLAPVDHAADEPWLIVCVTCLPLRVDPASLRSLCGGTNRGWSERRRYQADLSLHEDDADQCDADGNGTNGHPAQLCYHPALTADPAEVLLTRRPSVLVPRVRGQAPRETERARLCSG